MLAGKATRIMKEAHIPHLFQNRLDWSREATTTDENILWNRSPAPRGPSYPKTFQTKDDTSWSDVMLREAFTTSVTPFNPRPRKGPLPLQIQHFTRVPLARILQKGTGKKTQRTRVEPLSSPIRVAVEAFEFCPSPRREKRGKFRSNIFYKSCNVLVQNLHSQLIHLNPSFNPSSSSPPSPTQQHPPK